MVKPKRTRSQIGKSNQRKGKQGENEVCKLFIAVMIEVEDKYNIPHDMRISTRTERNLAQYSGNKSGDIDVPEFCVEVKKADTLKIPAWWKQTLDQANEVKKQPVLFYKETRKQWRVVCITRLFTHLEHGRCEAWPMLDVKSDMTQKDFLQYYKILYDGKINMMVTEMRDNEQRNLRTSL